MKIFLLIIISLFFIYSPLSQSSESRSPLKVEGATTVSAVQAKELFDKGVLFVDVRKDKDWDNGRIPDAFHLNLKRGFTLDKLLEETHKPDDVVFYCNGVKCLRSSKATKIAVDWGFQSVFYFRGGFPAWKQSGYPVE